MNSKRSSSKSTVIDETKQNNFVSKFRRLKIEENILLQSIKKLDQKNYLERVETVSEPNSKNILKSLKDTYISIRNLFEDIKIITSTQELLADVEIDEIKKKVLELETSMRLFKLNVNGELNILRSAEQDLTKQLEQVHLKDVIYKKQAKISSSSLKQAVPSPVRQIMTLPLKCIEVQEFQDFMKNSSNRCGGWNEYHHNIFVMLWQKHFGNTPRTDVKDSFVETLAFDNFVEESLFKLQGIDKNSLLWHVEWYKKYLFLKNKQQCAIDKWKSNRKSIKKVSEKKAIHEVKDNRQPKCLSVRMETMKSAEKLLNDDDIERLMKPTKQWLSRCEDEQKHEQINNIENLEKLGIPKWRLHL